MVSAISDDKLNLKIGQTVVRIDREYFRAAEVDTLIGDASKAKVKLGWVPKVGLKELIREMVATDISNVHG